MVGDFAYGFVSLLLMVHQHNRHLAVEKGHKDDFVQQLHRAAVDVDGPVPNVFPNSLVCNEQIFGFPSRENERSPCVSEEDDPAACGQR